VLGDAPLGARRHQWDAPQHEAFKATCALIQ
jgi:hypothetical protein